MVTVPNMVGSDPQSAQYPPPNGVPTNTTKPVDVPTVERLEQNTLLGKFSGHESEAK